MITVKKNGREVAARVLNEPVNDVRGIAQCMIVGCQAHIVLFGEDAPADQIMAFMLEHDCDPKRFSPRKKRGWARKRV